MFPFLSHNYHETIVDFGQGNRLKKDGWIAADLHVHSSCSKDVLHSPEFHPEAIYQRARQMGMGYITITDHDTMEAYDLIGWERENLVTGVEITVHDPIRLGHTIHVNVYDLDRQQFKELMDIAHVARNIYTFLEFLKDQHLPFIYNHPFWFSPKDTPDYHAVERIVDYFPVIEYNRKRVDKKNLLAMWLASKYNKGIMASTDTHIGEVGKAYTLSKGDTFREYFNNVAEKNAYIVPQDLNLKNLNTEILTWIELLFSLNEIKGTKNRYTGFVPVDGAINFFANAKPEDHPFAFPLMESFLRKVAKTGIFSFLYLFSQKHMARRIGKLLNITEPIPDLQEGLEYEPSFPEHD